MPSEGTTFYFNEGPRREAWKQHYIRKGCHPIKAAEVAYRKTQRSNTWPPETKDATRN